MEVYKFKRKEFEVVENLENDTKKVIRKGKYFLVKHYENTNEFERDKKVYKLFEGFGIQVPHIRYANKVTNDLIFDFVDAKPIIENLQFGDFKEEIYDGLFKTFWRCRQEKISLDFRPEHFYYFDGKLYYFSTIYKKLENSEDFLNKDLRYWFYTKESVSYLKSKGYNPQGTLEEEYATNKRITLMCVKYYR